MGISFPCIPSLVLKILFKKAEVKYQVHWFPAKEMHHPGTSADVQTAALCPIFQAHMVPVGFSWACGNPAKGAPRGGLKATGRDHGPCKHHGVCHHGWKEESARCDTSRVGSRWVGTLHVM